MKGLALIVTLLLFTQGFAASCTVPSTITSSSQLNSIFDTAFQTIQYQNSLFDYLADPTFDNLKSYLMTQGRYFIPLWCAGGLSFIFFVICAVQMCCYDCCRRQSCGNKISRKTFRPCMVSCCVYTYMTFSLILIGFGIATFILSSDLIKQTDYTICSADDTLTQLFEGTQPGVSPSWAGADNFYSYALQISTNFPNALNDLNTQFTSNQYQTVASTTSGSAYAQAISTYSCPSSLSSSTVTCPYANFFQCAGGVQAQTPTFSKQFCNTSVNTSAASMVALQQQTNSTTWHDNIVNLNSLILSLVSSPADFSTLESQSQQLQNAINTYKPQLNNSVQIAQDNIYYAQIGMYTFIAFFILMGVISFSAVCLLYCSKRYTCRYMLYIMWVIYGILSIVFFFASGLLVIGTLTAYDGCTAYHQMTTDPTTLKSQPFYNTSQFAQTIDTCFFPLVGSDDTVFGNFSTQTTFDKLTSLQTLYSASLPSSAFFTVSDEIKQQLNEYAVNPNTVTLVGATTTQNPQAALDSANTFAANGGSSTCKAVNDKFVYNPINCYPRKMNQAAGSASCIQIANSSASVVSSRSSSFTANNCSANFNTYQSNFNALNTFGNGIDTLTSQYLANTGLNTYKTSYFNYYSIVNSFMNNQTQQLFLSFLQPFSTLVAGSQCSFLTTKLDTLVSTACNNNFPYIYIITAMTICMCVCFFFLMTFSYFLTVRMEFYQYIQGDYANYDEYAPSDDAIAIEMADMSHRKQLMETTPDNSPNQRYETNNRYEEKYASNDRRYDGKYDHEDPRYKRYNEDSARVWRGTPPPQKR